MNPSITCCTSINNFTRFRLHITKEKTHEAVNNELIVHVAMRAVVRNNFKGNSIVPGKGISEVNFGKE